MKKLAAIAAIAGSLILATGCSSQMDMDDSTGVVKINGIPVNEVIEDYGLDNTFEISVDPESGEVTVDGTPINELVKVSDSIKEDTEDEKDAVDDKATEKKKDAKDEKAPDKKKTAKKDEASVKEEEEAHEAAEEEAKEDVYEDVDDSDMEVEFKSSGVKFILSDAFKDTLGIIEPMGDEVGFDTGVYLTGMGYYGIDQDFLAQLQEAETIDEESMKKLTDSSVSLPEIWGIDRNRSLDDMVELLEEMDRKVDKKNFEKIKKVGDCTFYYYFDKNQDNIKNLDPDFREEFEILSEEMKDVIKNAEFFKPENPYEDIVGKKLEFTTTDMDGNEISSEEIFSKNDVTMVNVWATWCHYCVEELPDLEKINERVSDKGCAIVGLLGDGYDEDTIEEGKDILKENGVTYLNILPWEGATEEDFPMRSGWPTSFFVDKDGIIMCHPLVGVNLEMYEKVMDKLSSGLSVLKDIESAESSSPIAANNVNQYRIYVADTDGVPVKDVTIQFCDDSTCRVAKTDDKGLAVFKVDPAKYEVHVLKNPKGYKKNTETFSMPDEYSDLHIVLEKE